LGAFDALTISSHRLCRLFDFRGLQLNQAQVYFIVGTFALPALLVVLHAVRTRTTLGPFFGVAGVYSLMLWQLLQTGWWVSFIDLHFNAALTLFIPPLTLGFLLVFALDGLRTARAYMLMVATTSAGAWLFSVFRENLAQQLPLPYLIVLSNQEHLAIIVGLVLAQVGGMMTYTLIKERASWFSLPGGHAAGVLLWLVGYSSIEFDLTMGVANLRNEWPVFLIATAPSLSLLVLYGLIANKRGLFMPVRAWRHLLSFWRTVQSDTQTEQSGEVIVNRDHVISELRLLNRQLADSAHLMETHMREAYYGIVITDDQGRIRRANRPARELLITPMLEGLNAQNVLAAQIKNIGTLDALVAAGEGTRHLANHGDAQEMWLEIQATRLKGEGLSAGYYLILKDVTTLVTKERRQLVSSRVRDLHQTGRVLAHDFSNLLIAAEAQVTQLKTKAVDNEGRQSLFALESALRGARGMLQELGTGTQFGSPRLNNLDLGNLVDESVTIVRAAAQAAGVIIESGAKEGFRVEADASQMIRVFTNLLRNAIRASAPGSNIAVTLQRSGKQCEVWITDHGRGMTPEQLRMAFDPGFSSKDGGQGGLGLAISYLITEAHGGHLELRANEQGGGLSAIVSLSAVPGAASEGPAYDSLSGLAVILAMPQVGPAVALASQLQRKGCTQVAEVYTPEELCALVLEEPDWQVMLVAPDFPLDRVGEGLPASLEIRFLPDPYS
jgi:signal transduction histidine kinase